MLFNACLKARNVEIYPREGTETPNERIAFFQFHVVEIYPREGTETIVDVFDLPPMADVEIYPREGTETRTSDIFPLLHVLKFIPVRGRKRRLHETALRVNG